MSALDHAARGDKLDIHLLIYESKLAIIDGIAQRHGISRAAVVEALATDYANGLLQTADFTKPQGRRPSHRKDNA